MEKAVQLRQQMLMQDSTPEQGSRSLPAAGVSDLRQVLKTGLLGERGRSLWVGYFKPQSLPNSSFLLGPQHSKHLFFPFPPRLKSSLFQFLGTFLPFQQLEGIKYYLI